MSILPQWHEAHRPSIMAGLPLPRIIELVEVRRVLVERHGQETLGLTVADEDSLYVIIDEVRSVEPRTISKRGAKAWKKDASLVGGVALCLHHTRCESGFEGEDRVPKLWYTHNEWSRFIAQVKHGALDRVTYAISPGECFTLWDTKQAALHPLWHDELPLGGTALQQCVQLIAANKWDRPPQGFSTPSQLLPHLAEFLPKELVQIESQPGVVVAHHIPGWSGLG